MPDVETIHLDIVSYPKAIMIANQLAELGNRTPHDAIRLLIEIAGQKEVDRLKAEATQRST